jgi:hypothetical protein
MAKVKRSESGRIEFVCPGCGEAHSLNVEGTENTVELQRNFEKLPSPSILYTSELLQSRKARDCWCITKKSTQRIAVQVRTLP